MIKQKEHFHGSDLEKIEQVFGISKDDIISFAANVNPLGVSPRLREALSSQIDVITSYPDREYTDLRKAIAAYCDCNYKHVLVGNGCTELISLFIQLTTPKKALLLGPTYSEYERELTLNGAEIAYYMLREENNFELKADDFIQAITPDVGLVIICNPNNPTSSYVPREQMRIILEHCKAQNTFVMVDETYIEFTSAIQEQTVCPLTEEFDNLILLRGTSKFFAAPGLRLGYAITGNQDLIKEINTNKNPWMINSLAVVAGITMFSDEEYIQSCRSLCEQERDRVIARIEASGKYKTYPSHGNFVLMKILDPEVSSYDLFERAIKKGLMIRDCSTFPTLGDRYIRMCFMLPEDNDRLLDCLLK